MAEIYKPGTDNVPPGEYIEVDQFGRIVPNAKVVHIDWGDRLPPSSRPGLCWMRL